MLLLLLSFYANYDLLNCEENVTAKLNESSLLDSHHQNLLQQVNALLVVLEQKTRKLSGLLADDHPYALSNETNALRDLILRTVMSEKDQNHQNLKKLTKPSELLGTPPFADGRAPDATIFPYPLQSGRHFPPPFYQQVHWAYPLLSIFPQSLIERGPSLYATSFTSSSTTTLRPKIHSSTPHTLSSAKKATSLEPKAKNWFEGLALLGNPPFADVRAPDATISPYPVRSGPHFPPPFYQPVHWPNPLLSLYPQSLIERGPSLYATSFSSSSTPHTLSSAKKATSLGPKAKNWFEGLAPYTRVKKITRKASRNQTQATVHIPPRMSTPPSYMWQKFDEAEHGPLNEALDENVSRPGQTPEYPHKDVLYEKLKVQKPSSTQPPNPRYRELMKQLDEGYLVVFGIEMFRLIAKKDKREVQEVMSHVETIYNTSLRTGLLVGVDKSFLSIFGNLVTMTTEDEIDTLRTYSSMMFRMLLKRKEVLSPKVNSMIDQAGLTYNDADGNRLLCSLSQFEDYPNTHKSSYSVCEGLVDSILQPFRRPANRKSRQALLSSINIALQDNFPQLLTYRGVETPTTLSLIGTTISSFGTRSRKRKNKHHHHKKKRKRKRRLKPEYDNENTRPNSPDLDYQQPNIIEAMTTETYTTIKILLDTLKVDSVEEFLTFF